MSLVSVSGILLPSSVGIGYTVPANLQTNYIELSFTNHHATQNRDVTVWLVPNGGSPGNSNRFLYLAGQALSMRPGQTVILPCAQVLNAGDTIRWMAGTASIVQGSIDVQEISSAGIVLAGVSRRHFGSNAAFITNSIVTARTIPAGNQARVIEVALHNTGASPRTVEVWFVPSGQVEADRYKEVNLLLGRTIKPGHTVIVQKRRFLTGGDFISWRASVTNEVMGRISTHELVL